MASAPQQLPYSSSTQTVGPSPLVAAAIGLDPNSPKYSPFQALARQSANVGKMVEGMTSDPTWSTFYAATGLDKGSPLTADTIRAMRSGTMLPTSDGRAPVPQAPDAGQIPTYTNPSKDEVTAGKKATTDNAGYLASLGQNAAQGGLMSLARGGRAAQRNPNPNMHWGPTPGGPNPLANQQAQPQQQMPQDQGNYDSQAGGRPDGAFLGQRLPGPPNPMLRGFASGGASWSDAQQRRYDSLKEAGQAGTLTGNDKNVYNALSKAYAAYQKANPSKASSADAMSSAPVTLDQAMTVQTPFYDKSQQYNQYGGVTNPIYQKALDALNQYSQAPSQFQQGTDTMSKAASGLFDKSNYSPQQVAAQQVSGAQMNRGDVRDVTAQQAQIAQMQGGPNVQNQPSWTQEGTASQYMSPYMESALASQQRLANMNFAANQNASNSQAAQSHAFGGARNALVQGQNQLNQNLANQNMNAQGMNTAYTTGMGQFQNEKNLNQQAAIQNQLYGQGGYNAQAQNMGAQNTAYNNYVAQQLAAQQSNQGMDWNTGQLNTQNTQQANLANQAANLQAGIQNQQAGLSANQQNLSALSNAGQLGQGIGSLGSSLWGLQQNIPTLYGQAGSTAQGIAQQAANAAQQTAQNWWGGMNSAYQPVTNMLGAFGGNTATSNNARAAGT